MTRYLTAIVLILLAGYGFIEAWPLIKGPELLVISPGDNATFPTGILTISGNAARATSLTLNGAPLPHDQEGNFSSILTYPLGGSILTFVAIDRFGRTVTVTRIIFVSATSTPM